VSDKIERVHSISPDGKLISTTRFGEGMTSIGLRMGVTPLTGEAEEKLFDVRLTPFSRRRSFGSLDTVHWAPDGHSLTYIDTKDGVSNIWSQPLDGGKPVPLTNFKTGRIFNFDWSPDGKWLALARGSITSDVVLIEDLK
jgi:Tol biopolymer transport system component